MAACDSPECIAAQIRLQEARNKILSLCSQISQLRDDAKAKHDLAKAMFAVAASFAALAVAVLAFVPWPFDLIIGGVLFTIALGFLVAGVVYLGEAAVIEGQISELQKELTKARDDFDRAASELMAACDQECWGDVGFDQPACP